MSHLEYDLSSERVIEGNVAGGVEVMGKRVIRRKQLPDGLKEKIEYCKLKEEALDGTLWRIGFGRCCGRNERMNE